MNSKMTVRQFFERFPNDRACLDHVMEVRYGLRHVCKKCGQDATFHKLKTRQLYSCSRCGHHVHPTAGTVFEDTRTSMQLWFYAIYLFVTTRHGVSGKELQRSLGVTYKTAWRMGHQICLLMAATDGFETMQGHVEADEAYIGGYREAEPGFTGRSAKNKTIIIGIKERGGRMHAEVIPNVKTNTLQHIITKYVEAGSIVSTDELGSYSLLNAAGYKHGRVKHSRMEYVRHDDDGVKHHVNHVESFWRLFKNSVASTHISVSPKYMDRYLREFTFRSNHRAMQNAMFDLLIGAV